MKGSSETLERLFRDSREALHRLSRDASQRTSSRALERPLGDSEFRDFPGALERPFTGGSRAAENEEVATPELIFEHARIDSTARFFDFRIRFF